MSDDDEKRTLQYLYEKKNMKTVSLVFEIKG